MWLEQIRLVDFRCFFGEHLIDVAQEPGRNVTLIHAENGLGKTTLLNALLWCFYGKLTGKFEKKDDLVNYDALAAGRRHAHVEVVFEHAQQRYRARRYTAGGSGERDFSVMRIENGSHKSLDTPDAFINSVIPKGMAEHFLFDGEHAEVFLGEDNRGSVRRAVQDILGCSLIGTAISDLAESANYYRKQIPAKGASSLESVNSRIESFANQIESAREVRDKLSGDIGIIEQQIADIQERLRNTAGARQLQIRRDRVIADRARALSREAQGQGEVLRWLGDDGRFIVSTRIADQTLEYLNSEETRGRIPSPYNEEFVKDILELQRCICGAALEPGGPAYAAVAGLMQKAANATLRSRIGKVRALVSQLRTERTKAPGRLEEANKRLAEARSDVARCEAELNEISEQLSGVNFDQIAEQESKRNALQNEANTKRGEIGSLDERIRIAEQDKQAAERELQRLAEQDKDAQIFLRRYKLCETLKGRLENELNEEEQSARSVLRASIAKVLDSTSRKAFKLRMTEDYAISLVNDAGTQLPKSSGENQLLGLAFTAALVEFAKARQNASDHRLLRGTVAPLVLDSPFGQLDEAYRRTTAECVPQMAGQVVLMVSKSQGSSGVVDVLRERVGEEYVLKRHNKAPRDGRVVEVRQFNGKDVETTEFDASFDGSSLVRVTR